MTLPKAMTNGELLAQRYPEIFHVAAAGAAGAILSRGLLCAARLVDLYEPGQSEREAILGGRRERSHSLNGPGLPTATVRDQLPLSLARLEKALTDMSLSDWLSRLNALCFFWPTVNRVRTLLATAVYADASHDVLVVDTEQLVSRHQDAIRLAAINTGATRPFAHPRGSRSFLPLEEFPLADRLRRVGRAGAVAEIAVEEGVPDLAEVVLRVERWRGPAQVGTV